MAGVDHNYRVDVGPMKVWTEDMGTIRIQEGDRAVKMEMLDSNIRNLMRALDCYHRLRYGYGMIENE